ncbi:lamin tail domain-containing protein [Anaeromyxobacter oryzisoli]|uniref:lamin tail domain-containing protein n=1 Tax=Anaeromyxobacter oryzisoli TaxID=2925408 RepID=UPI001F58FFC2|nr:lamin tail domain-containing protein [Anaeromyxobacter sp. SG63]
MPDPHARVAELSPSGAGVAPEAVEAAVTFTAPVAKEGLLDGSRLVLVPAADAADALTAVESEAGASGLAAAVPVEAALEDGGMRATLRPRAMLRGYTEYALVLSSRALAADGRAVLDAQGRPRATVGTFETGAIPGPPPRPAVTEVRADAATPEAGGEYVELANLGDGLLDLAGFRLAKRTATGALSSCAIVAPAELVAPGAVALVVGGAYDHRYALPAGIVLATCGGSALLGGLANDRPPEVLLLDPGGATVSSLGAGGIAPICQAAVARLDPAGPDAAENLVCAEGEGSPGSL